MSRSTRSASAASGTFSTNEVTILSPNSFSRALRPLSWAKVQPPSPTGPTYANAIFRGSGLAGAEAAGAGAGAASSFLPQATRAALAAAARAATFRRERFCMSVMSSPRCEKWIKMESGTGVKRLADGSWHVNTNPARIARDQCQHHNRGQVRQHAQELAWNIPPSALQMELQHGHTTKQIGPKQNPC